MRQTFSGVRKKAKDKLSKLGDKLGGSQTNVDDQEHHRPASSSQSEPGIVAGGRVGEEISIGAEKSDPQPDNPLPASQSAVEKGHDYGGSDDKANAGEIDQRDLRPHSPAQTESGPSQEGMYVSGENTSQAHLDPEPDVGSIVTPLPTPRDGGTDGVWTAPFLQLSPKDRVGNPATSDTIHSNTAGFKNKSDWKDTASSAAKLFLRTVERASDAFPPLKSVAAGLCAILDNCEVRATFVHLVPTLIAPAENGGQQTDGGITGLPFRNTC